MSCLHLYICRGVFPLLLEGDDGGEFFRCFDAQLLVDVHAAVDDFEIRTGDTELFRQKAHHVIGRFPRHRRGGDADLQLVAFDLSYLVLFRAGGPQDVQDQNIAFPGVKGMGEFFCFHKRYFTTLHSVELLKEDFKYLPVAVLYDGDALAAPREALDDGHGVALKGVVVSLRLRLVLSFLP